MCCAFFFSIFLSLNSHTSIIVHIHLWPCHTIYRISTENCARKMYIQSLKTSFNRRCGAFKCGVCTHHLTMLRQKLACSNKLNRPSVVFVSHFTFSHLSFYSFQLESANWKQFNVGKYCIMQK